MTDDTDQPTLAVTSEPDMSWVDIAVLGQKRGVVILDYAPGWADFIDEPHFADVFGGDEPDHLSPGTYRWSGYKIGSWQEGDAAVATGGTFTPHRTTHEPRPAGDLREPLEGVTEHLAALVHIKGSNSACEDAIAKARHTLATHSPAPMAGEGWQEIASAPRDGTPFIATLVVHNLSGQKWWETHVIWADDETGEVASECEAGWSRVDDYSHWMPLPAPPAAAHPSTQEGGK